MSYILKESVGCCRQDNDKKIYNTKNPVKRLKQLFYDLLSEAEFTKDQITDIKKEINEYGEYENETCSFNETEAWVDIKDVYSTRTYLEVIS